jgi:hypothetical protein
VTRKNHFQQIPGAPLSLMNTDPRLNKKKKKRRDMRSLTVVADSYSRQDIRRDGQEKGVGDINRQSTSKQTNKKEVEIH